MRRLILAPWLLLSALALLAAAVPAGAGNWPRFRGPNGTGVADDKGVPVTWDAKSGVLWKAKVPGAGNSSPVVWGDRIFLQSASADGKERMLLCLSTADGQVIWSRAAPGARARINAKNSWASATPATDGERVYASFWDGEAQARSAYDFKGERLWTYNLGKFVSQHGAGASPVVVEDKVIFLDDQDGTSRLVALDSKGGTVAWQAKRKPFNACYSAPFLLQKPGAAPELIVASTAGVTGYDPRTGGENWNWNWNWGSGKPLRTVGSPVYGQGLVFVGGGDGPGNRHFVAVRADGKGDVSATNLAWEKKTNKVLPYVPGVLAWGEHLYYVNDQGDAGCWEAKTGAAVWEERRLCGAVSASPVLIDGKVYAIDESGDVLVFAAAPAFKLLARNATGERVFASPAVADNRLYVRGASHLFCIGKE